MKILFCIHRFPTLSHTFLLHEILWLVRRGHDVRIVSLARPTDAIAQPDVAGANLLSRTRYLDDFADARGVGRRWLDRLRPGAVARDIPAGTAPLAEEIQREGFDVVHATFANAPATLAMELGARLGLPYTFEAHAYDVHVDFTDARRKLATASRIFVSAEVTRSHLEHLGAPPDVLALKRLTFDRARCDALLGSDEQEGLLVSACRLHPIKGLFDALEVVRLLAPTHPSLRWVVLGDGPLRSRLARRASELGIEGRVELRGAVAQPELLATLSRAAVSLLPCRIARNGDRDCTPTALLEAMCLRRPVVSTRVGGIPEMIDHGVSGLLAASGDVETLAGHVDRLLGDPPLRRAMGARARETIDTRFDVDTNMRVLEEALLAAAAAGPRPRGRGRGGR